MRSSRSGAPPGSPTTPDRRADGGDARPTHASTAGEPVPAGEPALAAPLAPTGQLGPAGRLAPTGRLRPIRVLFIANRGEIARRIARTCASNGIRAVIPDATALDLLDGDAVVAAALAAEADALHPGYGFLSENASFASAVEKSGIRWVGPPPSAIAAMGDKAAARRLAASLGVPVLPGYDDADQSDTALAAAADRIGRPLLVKPAGGGGGKGMRVVRLGDDLGAAVAGARREAQGAFGDDRLILERYLDGPRHVEVQLLFDGFGSGVHLGERDCSTQRRHQKVLEETPSPAVDSTLRERLGAAALRLASAVGYRSAGTVEFLLEDSGAFHFLEMNTRLQVEHPVTELVTGRDLVADQLRIAAGEPLGFGQDAVRRDGHAIEVRLYAEDAEAGFLPATGRVEALCWPSGDGVRVDAGIDAGEDVSARFDPLLAKIVTWGTDRAEALDRLRAALDETIVLGPITNLRFLRWLVRQPWIVGGQARVDSLEPAWANAPESTFELSEQAWETGAAAWADHGGFDTWGGGWRLNAPSVVRLTAEGEERVVEAVGARRREVERGAPPATAVASDGSVLVDVDGRTVSFRLAPPPDVDRAHTRAAGRAHDGGGARAQVVAPMPGSVLSIHVAAGAAVAAGDPIATLEAMKMEHVVTAPLAGTVMAIEVAVGEQVLRGTLLAVVEP